MNPEDPEVLTLISTTYRNVEWIATVNTQVINLHTLTSLIPIYLTLPVPGEETGHLQPTLPQDPVEDSDDGKD